MATRTFRIGAHIWFVLHVDHAGKIAALEEHDWREGGHIGADKGKTYEETFVEHAVDRAVGEDFKAIVRAKATEFLTSTLREIDAYNAH